MAGFTGAWRRRTRPSGDPPLWPGLDPEHANPVDPPDPTMGDLTGAPGMPLEWAEGQYAQDPVASMFNDQTPVSHEAVVGDLPGVDTREAQAIGGAARSIDQGAFDQRKYSRPMYQETGSTHADVYNHDLRGDSPETLLYDRAGVGQPHDPDARSNRWSRHFPTGPARFDMRWFDASMRPRYQRNAVGSREREAVPNRTQYVSPYGAGTILRPDNWAVPIVRRTAQAPDYATDAVEGAQTDFGLGRWGL